MYHNINSLLYYTMAATDGVIGDVKDFYFDDQTWDVRYLVIKTGGWLFGREVLIAPAAIESVSWQNGLFPVNLTKKQISSSPDINTQKPVYRQQEIALFNHYGFGDYWGDNFYPGGSMTIVGPFEIIEPQDDDHPDFNIHLRSTAKITDYHIHAEDGEIGHVTDFIMDDKTWQIVSIVVNTHDWFGGIEVMIPITTVKKIDWTTSELFLDIDMAAVKNYKQFEATDFTV